MAWLESESVEIGEPVTLVRIDRLYRPDMTPTEPYDTTRRSRLVGDRGESAERRHRYHARLGVLELLR